MDKKRREKQWTKTEQWQTKKGLHVPLVKLKEQHLFQQYGIIKCLCQHQHISLCCPELLSIMCRPDFNYAGSYFNYTIHQLMFWLVPPVCRLKVGRPAHAECSWDCKPAGCCSGHTSTYKTSKILSAWTQRKRKHKPKTQNIECGIIWSVKTPTGQSVFGLLIKT